MIRLFFCLCLLAAPATAAPLKVSTWNLNWFTTRSAQDAKLPRDVHPRAPEDFDRLAFYARKLGADIIGFQEVDGPQGALRLFDPNMYTVITIDENVTQRVGLAVRKNILMTKNPDVTGLDVEPLAKFKLRDGLDATLTLPGGKTLRILVLHLKTGCQSDPIAHSPRPQCALLGAQIVPLAAWAAARKREGVAFLIMGDFNRIMDTPEEMQTALDQAAPLTRITAGTQNPCWDGAPFIDHIFAGGPARGWIIPGSLRVQLFREIGAAWKDKLSDHCPVSFKLDQGK